MTTIPTGDIGIDDIEVRRVTTQRSGKDPIIVEYGGAVIRIINGPTQNTWSAREIVLCDLYGIHRVGGNLNDAVAIERGGIRPTDIKTSNPHHDGRRRDGCMILRGRQHDYLTSVPPEMKRDAGYSDGGDYVFAVYERLDDLVILLDNVRLSARDITRLADPSFYARGDKRESSVEWTNIPGLSFGEMHARLDATPVYLRTLGLDPDRYRDEVERVRQRVADVQADHAEQADQQRPTEIGQTD